MSISAMKCALQSLESVEKVNGWNKDSVVGRHCTQSAHFLRQAIAEAEKQEAVAWIVDGEIKVRLDMAGKLYYSETNVYGKDVVNKAIEQEPVGYVSEPGSCTKVGTNSGVLHTEWVGLDPETMRNTTLEFSRGALWAERYLKEKNT